MFQVFHVVYLTLMTETAAGVPASLLSYPRAPRPSSHLGRLVYDPVLVTACEHDDEPHELCRNASQNKGLQTFFTTSPFRKFPSCKTRRVAAELVPKESKQTHCHAP